MISKIRKVKFNKEGKNPVYKVILECPEGKELYTHFDYIHETNTYSVLKVKYDGLDKGEKLAWYTKNVEKLSVDKFLEKISRKINKKYGYALSNEN
ncbi:hypothetical protein ACNQFZ_00045 [Schinkia sp. CFF1]